MGRRRPRRHHHRRLQLLISEQPIWLRLRVSDAQSVVISRCIITTRRHRRRRRRRLRQWRLLSAQSSAETLTRRWTRWPLFLLDSVPAARAIDETFGRQSVFILFLLLLLFFF